MKILSLGLDDSILDKTSASAKRAVEYGDLVEKYTIIAPSQKKEEINLSEKAMVYGSGGGNKLMRIFNIYKIAKRLLRDGAGNVITVQDQYYLALIGAFLAKRHQVGLEIQIHGFEKYCGLRKLIADYVLPRASAVRCVSQRLKKQLLDDFSMAPEKITVVPIFNELKTTDYKLKQGKVTDKFIFLTVGRLVPVKNIALQIKVMAEIVKKYPKTKLWIIGEGPLKNNLKLLIKKLKLDNNIKLLGQKTRKELDEIYGQADIFILTSNSEGWGLAVIEAAGYGLPIIMTDVGCAGEAIKNNENGLVVPVDDKQSLILAMERLLQDDVLRQKISEGARQAAAVQLSKQETLDLYLASWRKAADENKSQKTKQ